MFDVHTLKEFHETFFSLEPDSEGKLRPTLWDSAGEGRHRAVCLIGTDGLICVSNDPDVIADTLDAYHLNAEALRRLHARGEGL